jgi:hypothetical protein
MGSAFADVLTVTVYAKRAGVRPTRPGSRFCKSNKGRPLRCRSLPRGARGQPPHRPPCRTAKPWPGRRRSLRFCLLAPCRRQGAPSLSRGLPRRPHLTGRQQRASAFSWASGLLPPHCRRSASGSLALCDAVGGVTAVGFATAFRPRNPAPERTGRGNPRAPRWGARLPCSPPGERLKERL